MYVYITCPCVSTHADLPESCIKHTRVCISRHFVWGHTELMVRNMCAAPIPRTHGFARYRPARAHSFGHIQQITECFSHVSVHGLKHMQHITGCFSHGVHMSLYMLVYVCKLRKLQHMHLCLCMFDYSHMYSNSRSSIHCTVNLQRPLNTERPLCIFSGSLMYTVLLGIPGKLLAKVQRSHQLRQKSAALSKPGSRCPFLVIRCPMFRAVSLPWA